MASQPMNARLPKLPFPRGATGLLFDIMHPEIHSFEPDITKGAYHCLCRAMSHLKGNTANTFPSTVEGVIRPFNISF